MALVALGGRILCVGERSLLLILRSFKEEQVDLECSCVIEWYTTCTQKKLDILSQVSKHYKLSSYHGESNS